jgi:hypothetical protein
MFAGSIKQRNANLGGIEKSGELGDRERAIEGGDSPSG